MDIKVFGTLLEAEEYARLHIWEIVYCSEFCELVVAMTPLDDPRIDMLYHTCSSSPGSSEFDSEAFEFLKVLMSKFNLYYSLSEEVSNA